MHASKRRRVVPDMNATAAEIFTCAVPAHSRAGLPRTRCIRAEADTAAGT
jgi:hypothetical protein